MTILNSYVPEPLVDFVLIALVAFLITIGSLLLGVTFDIDFFAIVAGLAFGALIVAVVGSIVQEISGVPSTRYECIIDDQTSIKEVYDKYNVIERRGEIWVLEEKEIEEVEMDG